MEENDEEGEKEMEEEEGHSDEQTQRNRVQSQDSYRSYSFDLKIIIKFPKPAISPLSRPSVPGSVVLVSSQCCTTIITIHLENCLISQIETLFLLYTNSLSFFPG